MITERSLDQLVDTIDNRDHLCLVAIIRDNKGKARLAAFTRCFRSRTDPTTAEPAWSVCDEYQGFGLGHAIVSALRDEALANGITAFEADVLAENTASVALFKSIGETKPIRHECGVVTYRCRLQPSAVIPNN